MGSSRLSELDLIRLLRKLELEWSGKDYDILRKNCCHFVDTLCICMGVGSIPTWTTSLAGTGAAIAETGQYLDTRRQSVTTHLSKHADGNCWATSACYGVCSVGLGCFPEMCKEAPMLAVHEIEKDEAETMEVYRQQLIAKLPRSL